MREGAGDFFECFDLAEKAVFQPFSVIFWYRTAGFIFFDSQHQLSQPHFFCGVYNGIKTVAAEPHGAAMSGAGYHGYRGFCGTIVTATDFSGRHYKRNLHSIADFNYVAGKVGFHVLLKGEMDVVFVIDRKPLLQMTGVAATCENLRILLAGLL